MSLTSYIPRLIDYFADKFIAPACASVMSRVGLQQTGIEQKSMSVLFYSPENPKIRLEKFI